MAKVHHVILIGQPRVGKTTLFNRITSRPAPANYKPTQVISDYFLYPINTNTNLYFWDTDGSRLSYPKDFFGFSGKASFFLMYDTTKQESFDCLPKWIQEIKSNINNPNIIIIANKKDLQNARQVDTQTGQQFANENQCAFFEISALNDISFAPLLDSVRQHLTKKQAENQKMSTLIEGLRLDYTKCVGKRLRSIFTGGCFGADKNRLTALETLTQQTKAIENNATIVDKSSAFIELLKKTRENVEKAHQKSKIPCLPTKSALAHCIGKLLEHIEQQAVSNNITPS